MGINGISQKKIVDFAKALQITIEYLMEMDSNSVEEIEHPEYYTNPETAAIAQQIYDDSDLHALFDAARGSAPAALKATAAMLKTFKETNPDG